MLDWQLLMHLQKYGPNPGGPGGGASGVGGGGGGTLRGIHSGTGVVSSRPVAGIATGSGSAAGSILELLLEQSRAATAELASRVALEGPSPAPTLDPTPLPNSPLLPAAEAPTPLSGEGVLREQLPDQWIHCNPEDFGSKYSGGAKLGELLQRPLDGPSAKGLAETTPAPSTAAAA